MSIVSLVVAPTLAQVHHTNTDAAALPKGQTNTVVAVAGKSAATEKKN